MKIGCVGSCKTRRIADVTLFKALTLLLATAEQATIELDGSERETSALREAVSDLSERLYATLEGFARPE